MLIDTDFLKSTHREFCFLCVMDTNVFRSADSVEVNLDHPGPCYWGSILQQMRAEWQWHYKFSRLEAREKKFYKIWCDVLLWAKNTMHSPERECIFSYCFKIHANKSIFSSSIFTGSCIIMIYLAWTSLCRQLTKKISFCNL